MIKSCTLYFFDEVGDGKQLLFIPEYKQYILVIQHLRVESNFFVMYKQYMSIYTALLVIHHMEQPSRPTTNMFLRKIKAKHMLPSCL